MTTEILAKQRYLHKHNKLEPVALAEVPRFEWSHLKTDPMPVRVLRSRVFLVQVFTLETLPALATKEGAGGIRSLEGQT